VILVADNSGCHVDSSIAVVIAVCLNLAVLSQADCPLSRPDIATQYSQTDFNYEETTPTFLGSIEEDDVVLSHSEIKSVYQPEDLRVMGAAYDSVCKTPPSIFRNSERARLKVATLVMRAVNRGARDLDYLANMVMLDFLR